MNYQKNNGSFKGEKVMASSNKKGTSVTSGGAETFVVAGGTCKCSQGDKEAKIKAGKVSTTKFGTKPALTTSCTKMEEPEIFGTCKKLTKEKQKKEKAKGNANWKKDGIVKCKGKYKPVPNKWRMPAVTVESNGEDAIATYSKLTCQHGGEITITDDGQSGLFDGFEFDGTNVDELLQFLLEKYGLDGLKNILSKGILGGGIPLNGLSKDWQDLFNTMKGLGLEYAAYSKDPVNLATGNFSYDKEDLVIKGSSPLVFKRTYNAIGETKGVLGKNWIHSFEWSLDAQKADDKTILALTNPDGRVDYYEPVENGYYFECKLAPGNQLHEEPDGYRLITAAQEHYQFDAQGHMLEIKTIDGKATTFEYNEAKQLSGVHTISGSILFSYDMDGHLSSIKDQSGREVTFQCDQDCLVKVTSPTGTTLRYTYDEEGRIKATINPRDIDLVQNDYDRKSRTVKQVFPDGGVMTYKYKDLSKCVLMTEQNGNQITYYRDDAYRSVREVHQNGEEVKTYNDHNKLTSVQDKRGYKTVYHYDERGNLVGTTNPLGEIQTIRYNEQNLPIEIKQANDAVIYFDYDSSGNLQKMVNPLNNEVVIQYNSENRPVEICQPDGSQISMSYDERGNLMEVSLPNQGIIQYEYNERNEVIATTNARGYRTAYAYDLVGNLIQVTNSLGDQRTYQYNAINKVTEVTDFDGSKVAQEYNVLGKVSKITNQAGYQTTLAYDLMWNISQVTQPNGAKIAYLYNQLNQLEKVIDANGNSTLFAYDPNDNVTSVTLANGEKITYFYDPLNRRRKMVDPEGRITRYTYNRLGLIETIIDPAEQTTRFDYDELGQLIKQTDVMGNETTFTYTPLGNIETLTNALGATTQYEYYPGGQLKSMILPEGETETYRYDENGNVIEKQVGKDEFYRYEYDELDRMIRRTNPLGARVHFTYDALDRLIQVIDEAGETTTYTYTVTGELASVTDALGNETLYEYDEVGQRVKILQKGQTLDYVDELTEIQQLTRYQYDLAGNLTKVIDALGQEEIYRYDANHQLIEKIDKDGYRTKLSYTPAQDLAGIQYDDGRSVQLQYNELRQLKEVQDWIGKIQIELNPLGMPTKITHPNQEIVNYEWDALGNRTGLTYPNGEKVQYGYNQSGALTLLQTEQEEYRYHYENGRLSRKEGPNQLVSSYQYDAGGQLLSLTHQAQGKVINQFAYEYDPRGNKTGIERYRSELPEVNGKYHYEYDALSRLTQVSKEQEILRHYHYDSFGNRTKKVERGEETRYHYNSLNQLIQEILPNQHKAYTYDKRGNRVAEAVNNQQQKNYTFDATNMMTEVQTHLGGSATYLYNGLGNRVGQTVFKNGQRNQINYLLDLTRPYNNLLIKETNQEQDWYLWDSELLSQNGKEQALLDELGTPISIGSQHFAYDEFGKLESSITPDTFGFTGYQLDAVSGLNYAPGRYYDGNQGRFISEDKIKGIDIAPYTFNAYAYSFNNPLIYVDMDGNWPSLKEIGNNIVDGAKKVGKVVSDTAKTVKKHLDDNNDVIVGAIIGTTIVAAAGFASPVLAAAAIGMGVKCASDLLTTGKVSSWESTVATGIGSGAGAAIGGLGVETSVATHGLSAVRTLTKSGIKMGISSSFITDAIEWLLGEEKRDIGDVWQDVIVGGAMGAVASVGSDISLFSLQQYYGGFFGKYSKFLLKDILIEEFGGNFGEDWLKKHLDSDSICIN